MHGPIAVARPQLLAPTRCATLVQRLASLRLVAHEGRQGGGYTKADIAGVDDDVISAAVAELVAVVGDPVAFDAWHIVYPEGSAIAAHVDPSPADGLVHVRANLVIAAADGGVFFADDVATDLAVGDLMLFRPDVLRHAVSVVVGGRREVFSVGTVMSAEAAAVVFAAAAAGAAQD